MKKTLTLLVASTALTAAIGLPALSAMYAPSSEGPRPFAAVFENGAQALPFVLNSSDDDDDRYSETSGRGYDDDCDEDEDRRGSSRNPAPADTVAPPQNGLFGNGAPPQVQVN